MSPRPALTRLQTLDVAKIRTDGGTQARANIDRAVVQEYGELMEGGVEFPPVRTWFDGNDYWLVDGFHRVAATKRIGARTIAAQVLHGSLEDARWDSYRANSTHGLRRTVADLETVITRVLKHPKSQHLSNNQIAKHLDLPEATFRRWRKRLSSSSDEDATRVAVRGGASYPIKIAQIGRRQPEHPANRPSNKRLQQELGGLAAGASPSARRILNVIEKWIHGSSDASTALSALEGVIASLGRSRPATAAQGLTVWFTGLSSAGKSTISKSVYEQLQAVGYKTEWLDGDEVRQHLSKGLGFNKEDRDENVLRIGYVAERLTRNGVITLVSAIAPYRATREKIRNQIGAFIEVYVNAPIDVCERRDLKGIYQRARAGEMRGVTGIDDPYEPPLAAEIECHTDRETSLKSSSRVMTAVLEWLSKHHQVAQDKA
jgi:adenylylsulfate kinase